MDEVQEVLETPTEEVAEEIAASEEVTIETTEGTESDETSA